MALACQPSFVAQALLQTPVALRALMDACLPGDLTLAQLVTHPPARPGAAWDGRWVLLAFMVISFTEGGTAGSAALRKVRYASRRSRQNRNKACPFLKTCLSALS